MYVGGIRERVGVREKENEYVILGLGFGLTFDPYLGDYSKNKCRKKKGRSIIRAGV